MFQALKELYSANKNKVRKFIINRVFKALLKRTNQTKAKFKEFSSKRTIRKCRRFFNNLKTTIQGKKIVKTVKVGSALKSLSNIVKNQSKLVKLKVLFNWHQLLLIQHKSPSISETQNIDKLREQLEQEGTRSQKLTEQNQKLAERILKAREVVHKWPQIIINAKTTAYLN